MNNVGNSILSTAGSKLGIQHALTSMAQSHDILLALNASVNRAEGLYIILCSVQTSTTLACNWRPRSSLTDAVVGCSVPTHWQGRLELTGCTGAIFRPWANCPAPPALDQVLAVVLLPCPFAWSCYRCMPCCCKRKQGTTACSTTPLQALPYPSDNNTHFLGTRSAMQAPPFLLPVLGNSLIWTGLCLLDNFVWSYIVLDYTQAIHAIYCMIGISMLLFY